MDKKLSTPSLKRLRDMMPRFTISYQQALRVAERQASRLARTWEAEHRAIREADITSLTRMTILRRPCPGTSITECPSGVSRYEQGRWVIWLNPSETTSRQRFTLAHELKHIIDNGAAHTTVYKRLTPPEIEAVCDHFATNLLMSRHAVYHLWGDGLRTPESLAMAFHISVNAMRRRMTALGLPTDLDEPSVLDYADTFPVAPAPDTLPGHFLPDPPSTALPGVAA
ncbi:ImmA/IrrE family metallo-endopeptidase [Rhodococcoides fascians A25f]|uniref:ImmA/IrrE family metallo-endopeptidase n=1 Tax=Rhodococcoides fascians TaxID=1828 RepID=UPI00068FA7F7|nr:ImmA/IrrE family metallo-endopeptidase [Rhodococcus fascians]QII04363.1 ImmA/IrrE family metallo-endopeptidase [Rhodococcus fascians A25f]